MTAAEEIFADHLRRLQEGAVAEKHGSERQALVELTRSLDYAAYELLLGANRAELRQYRVLMLHGAAPALGPFLERVQGTEGPVPWTPTTPQWSRWADRYLKNCGQLLILQRLAAAEKFGLSEAKLVGKSKLILDVQHGGAEKADRAAGAWLGNVTRPDFEQILTRAGLTQEALNARLDEQVDVSIHWDWFIRYHVDHDLVALYHARAQAWADGCSESEALPPEALISGRPFGAWCEVNEVAFARVLTHIAFATRLALRGPKFRLRNLLSLYSRKDDLPTFWVNSGERPEDVDDIIEYLLLDADTVIPWQTKREIPAPYYIDLGKDFVMLPVFGGLLNAHAGLVWTLRDRHRQEWNTAAEGREEEFRTNLRQLFPAPRFQVSDAGVLLRREDGSTLTDIDAVVLDREEGEVGLFQLKWYDAVGFSLDERDSRRRHIQEAGQWVDKVSGWLERTSPAESLRVLGIEAPGLEARPMLFVLVRNDIRFSGNEPYDRRAAWLRWAELVRALVEGKTDGVLSETWRKFRQDPPRARHRGRSTRTVKLEGLTVEVRVS